MRLTVFLIHLLLLTIWGESQAHSANNAISHARTHFSILLKKGGSLTVNNNKPTQGEYLVCENIEDDDVSSTGFKKSPCSGTAFSTFSHKHLSRYLYSNFLSPPAVRLKAAAIYIFQRAIRI